MEPYIILVYAIKYEDMGFFWYIIQKICMIFQALSTQKLKYIKAILR